MAADSIPSTILNAKTARAKMLAKPHATTEFLKTFWTAFNWHQCDRPCSADCYDKNKCLEGCLPKAKKLELLRIMAQIRIARPFWNKKRRYEMRKNFNRYFGGFDVVAPCFICGGEWRHRHHIIQIQYGGGNTEFNIVRLCRTCHWAVHNP